MVEGSKKRAEAGQVSGNVRCIDGVGMDSNIAGALEASALESGLVRIFVGEHELERRGCTGFNFG